MLEGNALLPTNTAREMRGKCAGDARSAASRALSSSVVLKRGPGAPSSGSAATAPGPAQSTANHLSPAVREVR